jgi:hypothetical protein
LELDACKPTHRRISDRSTTRAISRRVDLVNFARTKSRRARHNIPAGAKISLIEAPEKLVSMILSPFVRFVPAPRFSIFCSASATFAVHGGPLRRILHHLPMAGIRHARGDLVVVAQIAHRHPTDQVSTHDMGLLLCGRLKPFCASHETHPRFHILKQIEVMFQLERYNRRYWSRHKGRFQSRIWRSAAENLAERNHLLRQLLVDQKSNLGSPRSLQPLFANIWSRTKFPKIV